MDTRPIEKEYQVETMPFKTLDPTTALHGKLNAGRAYCLFPIFGRDKRFMEKIAAENLNSAYERYMVLQKFGAQNVLTNYFGFNYPIHGSPKIAIIKGLKMELQQARQ